MPQQPMRSAGFGNAVQGQAMQGGGGGGGNNHHNNNNNMYGQGASAMTGPSQPHQYTLSGVLHFLQSEWRKFERERNEWEIERAEMRARVALLEGERRGMDNAKTDLMKRIKMLEYALRQERSRSIAAGGGGMGGTTAASTSTNQAQTQNQIVAPQPTQTQPVAATEAAAAAAPSAADKAGETNVPVSGSPDLKGVKVAETNGVAVHPTMAPPSDAGPSTAFNPHARAQQNTRDPKNWTKSREYLKACLQEIDYLTSSTTLNPLPNRAGMPNKDLNHERLDQAYGANSASWWDDNSFPNAKPESTAPNGAFTESGQETTDIGQLVKRPMPRNMGPPLGSLARRPMNGDDAPDSVKSERSAAATSDLSSRPPAPTTNGPLGLALDPGHLYEDPSTATDEATYVPPKVDELEGSPVADSKTGPTEVPMSTPTPTPGDMSSHGPNEEAERSFVYG